MYVLSVLWPGEERARWERVKADDHLDSERRQPSSQVPPYTAEEKEWLKQNWGNEFKFLLAHGLKIHDEEDRAEGRVIVRATMQDSDDDEFTISYTNGRGAKPIVPHADGHLADFHFSEKELIWIEENFGNSESFLITYGLKFYNDDDCEEGKQIVQAMMRDNP